MTQPVQHGYLLGIDTGSSKTHAIISDLAGNVLGFGEAGSGNYEVVGLPGLKSALSHAVNLAKEQAGIINEEIVSMGLGLAGYDWTSEEPLMIEAIEALSLDVKYQFVNDVVLGLIAGSTHGWGIAVDAGTGNNVRGLDERGKMGRITGNGIRFGEIGGASELVWKAMVAVTYSWSQRGPKTGLTEYFMDYVGVPSEETLIEALAMEEAYLPSDLARGIFSLAEMGDLIAHQIITESATELARNTNAVIRQLNMQNKDFEVVLIGSVFNAGDIYLSPFKETVLKFAPKAKFLKLSVPPVVGGVLLAAKTIGLSADDLRDNLIQSTLALISKNQ